MNNMAVRKSLKRHARAEILQEEQKRGANPCGHRGLHWGMGQYGKPRNVRCAQKMTRVSMMWKFGRSGAREGAELAMK
jgi:hypothetical protein